MFNRSLRCTLSLSFFLISASLLSYGQTSLATVTGTITDATGAVLANAPVELRNHENGQIFRAASSDAGNYTISQLPIGDYDLTVTVTGFKTYSHAGFHLAAAQTMREDIRLEVGNTTESVTVTAEASLLKTESSEVSQNVTLTQLNNLPILAVGATGSGFRDPYAAARLVPGVRYANGSNAASGTVSVVNSMVVNGTPANSVQTRLDGMTQGPTGPRLLGATMQTQPSVDAIQEVAIETSNFAAEFGTAGGAMINMVTKSGTNAFHGTAYDYGTNEAMNAHQPYTGNRAKIRQNDFGGTFGGPVKIPKIYDGTNKTFFFFSVEIFKQANKPIVNATVPLPAYRTGDFSSLITNENRLVTTATGNYVDPLGRTIQSGTIFDPSTQRAVGNTQVRDPFPGNKIPLSSFDPVSAKILPLIPLPVGPNADKGIATNNLTGAYDGSRTSKIPSIKIDHNLGSKSRVSFYLQETNTRSPRSTAGADPFPDLLTGGVTTFSSGTTIRLNYDYTLTPRLLLHFGAGWNDSDFALEAPVANYSAVKELGLRGGTEDKYFPRLQVGTNTNQQIGGLSNFGTYQPTASFERRPSGTISASYVTGGHTFKFGADWRLEKFPNYVRGQVFLGAGLSTATAGGYQFGSNWTQQPALQGITTNNGFNGFQFASFLLGGADLAANWAPTALSNSKTQTGLYAQDTWKVTRKLTLDYGLRWDLGTYAREQYGRNGSIGLAIPNPAASGRLGATQFESTCQCNFASNYKKAFGPRLGLAYQINPKTVFRAGIGVVYNATSSASGNPTAYAVSSTLPANSGQIAGLFRNGLPSSVNAVWPSFDPGVGQGAGTVIAMPTLLDPNAGRPARLLQWNIALQREINRNLVIDAAYVGNRGVWWTSSNLATLNALSQDKLKSLGFTNFASASEAALLTANVSTLATNTAARTTLASRGITGFPYANFPTSQTVRQSLLDYPQYTGSGLSGSPLGNTWYDAFQITVTQRFSHGLSLNANYNYSKNLDTMTSVADVFNRQLSKNISGNDLPHQLRLTAQYVVPQIKTGPAFLTNRFVSYALADWGLGIYFQYQSAALNARPTSNGTTPISQFLGRGPGSAQLKLNADGSYMNPWSVDWTDYDGKHHTDPIDINCHCFDPTKNIVLNPNAWENIPDGQWGAQQGSLRFYRGFRVPSENANFSRNFRLKEGINLNIRAEFNNVFNRMQYGSLGTPIQGGSFATKPTISSTGATAGLYSGGFGTILPSTGVPGQRTGTFVARLTF